MKLRFLSSVLIFISAYSPLSVIFLIQDFELPDWRLKHPEIVLPIVGISIISCIVIWAAVRFLKTSTPTVKIVKVSNRSGELVNYSIPYLVSFFVINLDDIKMLLSFGFFMVIMYWMTLKTHNIFVNPILACLGYNLYDVQYEKNGQEREDFFLVKGPRLKASDQCRIVELSEQLFLVTAVNPKV
ncbi:MAG: hypothetical protein PHY43_08115 [Verrucomicrobiales bacterium]|nr:hypothetical protein [Verrucomicrobiales bacterium]